MLYPILRATMLPISGGQSMGAPGDCQAGMTYLSRSKAGSGGSGTSPERDEPYLAVPPDQEELWCFGNADYRSSSSIANPAESGIRKLSSSGIGRSSKTVAT